MSSRPGNLGVCTEHRVVCGSEPLTNSDDACLLAILIIEPNQTASVNHEFPSLNDHGFGSTSHCGDDGSAKRMTRSRQGKRKTGMNSSSSVELRRIAHGDDMPAAQQAEALVHRENFSLDDDHDANKPASTSLWSLTAKDQRSFFLLVLLYFLQGVPMGLAMGSVPYLLKSRLSYGEIGVFTLAAYPYSMKLLWSPIVDAIWSRRIGRRKSWIVPIQTLSAIMLLWMSGQVESLMEKANQHLYFFTFVFFSLVMLCATQDVAVDGTFISDSTSYGPSQIVGHGAVSREVAGLTDVLTAIRLGSDAYFPGKSVICFHRSNCRPYCWAIPFFHSLFGLQFPKLCEQMVSRETFERSRFHSFRLPQILGLDISPRHHWASIFQKGRKDEQP